MVCCSRWGASPTDEQIIQEFTAAKSAGIDGFALNCGEWRGSRYRKLALRFYQLAERLPWRFYLFLSLDGVASEDLETAAGEVSAFGAQYRVDGKVFISTYGGQGGDGERGRALVRQARESNLYFVPYFFPTGQISERPSRETIEKLIESYSGLSGYFYFGAAGQTDDLLRAQDAWLSVGAERHVPIMLGVSPFYRGNGSNFRVFDRRGVSGYEAQWRSAIFGGANWVQVVTWNDWMESTYVSPVNAGLEWGWGRHFGVAILSHDGFLVATRYLSRWFKEGAPPPVEKDRFILTYIPHLLGAASRSGVLDDSPIGLPRGMESLDDVVYVTTILGSGGQLTCDVGGRSHRFRADAGMTHFSFPKGLGRPACVFTAASGRSSKFEGPIAISSSTDLGRYNVVSVAYQED